MLSENCVLLSFDLENMFPNIDNKYGLLSIKEALTVVMLMLIGHNVFLML